MSAWLTPLLLTCLGYVSGSVCFAYLAGRLWRSFDLRSYGSRKLSASNVYNYLGFAGMALVGILDIAKAALPIWLSMRLRQSLTTSVLVGLAAMAGHNWSLFLGFKGGRGIGAALGLLLLTFPLGVLWILAWVAAGRFVPHMAAAPALVSIGSLPALAYWRGQSSAVVWGCAGILVITVLKRLEANRLPITPGESRWRVLMRRLLLDRDIADFDAWVAHRPDADGFGPEDARDGNAVHR
ncbi:MAG: glycerol-3-phosphate acyltransferase [Anaerolineae bacterium]|nr:glycerol-3-phosphate acyltransferase [Anaerolineae bacterium]